MKDISPQELKANLENHVLVDVREPHEYTGPLGYIEGVTFASLGQDLLAFFEESDPSKSYVFICKSGYRSSVACELAKTYGINKVYNLKGGMIEWGSH